MSDEGTNTNELEERLEALIANTEAQNEQLKIQQAQVTAELNDIAHGRARLTETLEQVASKLSEAQTNSGEINTILGSVTQLKNEVETHLESAKNHSQAIIETNNKIADTQIKSDELKNELKDSSEKYDALVNKIEGLLPGATTAGLAKSFAERKAALIISKLTALLLFAGSIIGFIVLGTVALFASEIKTISDFFIFTFERTPFIAGLLLLEEFGRRQYNAITKLEEDYAYKESISKAFEGYRKEFESMENPALQQSLSEKTMEALFERPGRLLDQESKDKIPAEILSMLSASDTPTAVDSSTLLPKLAASLKSRNTRWASALAASILIAGAIGYYVATATNVSANGGVHLEIDASKDISVTHDTPAPES